MDRRGAILYCLAAGAIVLLLARESVEPAIWLFQEHGGDTVALAVTGWLIATLGSIALSICVWLVARRSKLRWLWHLAFIPTAILMFREGSALFFYGIGVRRFADNLPGAYALFMAAAFLLLTLLVHTAALSVQGYRTIKGRANDS